MGSLNDIYNDFFGSIERKNQRDLEKLTKELYGKDGKTPSWDDMPSSSEALRKAEEALAPWGENAAFFIDLAREMLNRVS